MSRKSENSKKIIRYAVLILAAIMLVSSALMFMQVWERNRGEFAEKGEEATAVIYNGNEYQLKDNVETFLVLGLDKFDDSDYVESYNNDKQADFLMLFVFDNDAKKCTAIHINRDTMTDVNILGVAGNRIDTRKQQIALAHTQGNGRDVSCRNTADAVSALLSGMKVDHYVSLTMDSVKLVNDYVGGVKVKVLDDFSSIDETLVKGKTVTLKGDQALTYVRSRYGLEDSSNIRRMERQRQYLDSLYNKAMELYEKDEEFILKAFLEVSEEIVSDRSVTQLQELVEKFIDYEFTGISSLEGENKKGERYIEFYPYEDSIKEIVYDLFYNLKS